MTTNSNPLASDQVFYFCGIAVVAAKFRIGLDHLSLGDQYGLGGEARLQSLEEWCDTDQENTFYATLVENYVTALLAGPAGSFIHVRDLRCHIQQTFGNAGLEEKFLRQVWQCLQGDTDRAVAIIVGSLGDFDDGDAKATTRRLWHRAIRILDQPRQAQQLKELAKLLLSRKYMSGSDVEQVLKHN